MVGGIASLGVITATLASWLIEQVGQRAAIEAEASEEPMRAELAEMNLKIDHLTGLLEKLNNPVGRQLLKTATPACPEQVPRWWAANE